MVRGTIKKCFGCPSNLCLKPTTPHLQGCEKRGQGRESGRENMRLEAKQNEKEWVPENRWNPRAMRPQSASRIWYSIGKIT